MAKLSAARNKSRRFLVQALYQAQIAEVELSELVSLFQEDHNMKRADLAFFREVIEGINDNYSSLVNYENIDRPNWLIGIVKSIFFLSNSFFCDTNSISDNSSNFFEAILV